MRRVLSNRKVQIGFNGGFAAVLLVVMIVGGRKFAHSGFALRHADPLLLTGATLLFLIAYAFKAWGWQRLFAADDRPCSSALAFAGGAACVGGVALPGRLDDALRIACVKRFPGVRTGLGAVALSLVVLGLLDNVALAPFSAVAAVYAHSWTVRVGFAVVALAGVLAAALVASLPKLADRSFFMRFRIGRWLAEHTHSNRRAVAALAFISISWTLRATAVFLLLDALSMRSSFPLALAFLVCVRCVGGSADRACRRGDAGRSRLGDPHRERRARGRSDRVRGRGSGARRRNRRDRHAPPRRVAPGDAEPRPGTRARARPRISRHTDAGVLSTGLWCSAPYLKGRYLVPVRKMRGFYAAGGAAGPLSTKSFPRTSANAAIEPAAATNVATSRISFSPCTNCAGVPPGP